MIPIAGPIISNRTSDPRIRYDRLSRRWIIIAIDIPNGAGAVENRIVMAVSDSNSISAATTWTFFYIPASLVGDFIDYPTLGIDGNALYIGANIFTTAGGFRNTEAWVVRKSLGPGPGPDRQHSVRQPVNDPNCSDRCGDGPWTPQGVDNADGAAAEGYFIGVDACVYGKLIVNRVGTPAGTPTLSAAIELNVAATSYAGDVPHLGNNGGNGSALGQLDGLDDRLYAAQMRNGRLWTAHSFLVEDTGVAMPGGAAQTVTARNGVRWYELQNMTATPAVAQSGTVFDNTPGNAQTGPVAWYWIPSIAVNGQGHAALGFSAAGPQARANAAFTGRLATDPAGTMDAVTRYTNTIHAYNPAGDGGTNRGRRWGDYSYTSVDPLDQMTMWTIQEYTEAPNSWGTRVAKLLAPPPATPSAVSTPTIAAGQDNVAFTITGTSTGGSGWFDPTGSTTYTRIAVEIGGVTVKSVTVTSPTTMNVTVSTVGAAPGGKLIRVINPDGQVAQDSGQLLTVTGTAAPFFTSPNSLICAVGAACNFTFTTGAGPAASTIGVTGALPSGVTFAAPSLSGTPAAGTQGTYTLTVTAANGTLPNATQTFKLIVTAACGGFSDVTGADSFCNAAEWLKNRGITLGCTATDYCPNNNVTRAQMALFMQRLGDTIAPTTYSDNVQSTGGLTLDTRPGFCTTADFAPVNFPRVAMVTWSFAGLASSELTARIYSATSFDSGGTFATNESNLMRVTALGAGWVGTSATVKVNVPAGASPRFRLRTDREAGTLTAGNFMGGRCNIGVSLVSVNGGASPYDPPAGPKEQ